MLPKERVIAALEFKRPDRIPTGEMGFDFTVTEAVLGHPTLYRAKWREYQAIWQGRRDEYVESCKRDIVALARKFEHDIVPVFLVPSKYKLPPQPEFISPHKWRMPDGRIWVYSPETQGNAIMLEAPRPTRVQELLPHVVDVDESQLELVRFVVQELGGTHFILARPPDDGIFPHDTYDFEFLLTGMIDQPELIRRILEIESTYQMALGAIMLDVGCDGVVTHNDLCSADGPFMSPAMFRSISWPWLKAWVDMAHAKGKYFLKHTDGKTWKILDAMIEAGIDGWHGIQPAIGMTLPALQERYGGRLCFWGGVDLDTLVTGTEAEVEEQVRIAIGSAPRAGGLILGAGNSVMVGVQVRNYLALTRAAQAFRDLGA
jgi:hypothetical protein